MVKGHRLNELRRFFQDYKVLEGKEVRVGDFSNPEEAKDAIRHAMGLYDGRFASSVDASGRDER